MIFTYTKICGSGCDLLCVDILESFMYAAVRHDEVSITPFALEILRVEQAQPTNKAHTPILAETTRPKLSFKYPNTLLLKKGKTPKCGTI